MPRIIVVIKYIVNMLKYAIPFNKSFRTFSVINVLVTIQK